MSLNHRLGAGMQISRPRVVAQAGPEPEHLVERRQRECAHSGPTRGEAREIRSNSLDRGLLQHDLGEPHAIRIGPLAGQCAPRKHTAVPVVPPQEGRRRVCTHRPHATKPSREIALSSGAFFRAFFPCPTGAATVIDDRCGRGVHDEQAAQDTAAPSFAASAQDIERGLCKTGLRIEPSSSRAGPRLWAPTSRNIVNPKKFSGRAGLTVGLPQPGKLMLRVEGPVAVEIQHLSNVILERVNSFFGWQAVDAIRIRQAPLRRAVREFPHRLIRKPWSAFGQASATSRTMICATRWPDWERRSSSRDRPKTSAATGPPASRCHICRF